MSLVANKYRLLLYYKGNISALTLFAQQPCGSVCFPEALPALAAALEEEDISPEKVSLHPAVLLNAINQSLKLPNDLLSLEPGFSERIDAPGGVITVYLARFNLLDPPHKLLQSRNCLLKTLPELRNSAPAELELLRRAYIKVMEG